jgi:uncharacterized protein YjbI with pentapeptide repeats
MANQKQLDALMRGKEIWNDWREKNPTVIPELTDAYLSRANLTDANLTHANLSRAYLSGANLSRATLPGADLTDAHLSGAHLIHANLSSANLNRTTLIETNLKGAILADCSVYGCSAWNLRLIGANQRDLVITPRHEPKITVDNLEVGQFIYLLLNNERIRDVINTITSKVVLSTYA